MSAQLAWFELEGEVAVGISDVVVALRLPVDVLGERPCPALSRSSQRTKNTRESRAIPRQRHRGRGATGRHGRPAATSGRRAACPAGRRPAPGPGDRSRRAGVWFTSGHVRLAVVPRRVGVEHRRQRPQPLLGAVVRAAGPQVVVEDVAEERRPVAVQHPVDGHLVAGPAQRGERLELCAGRLVVRELGLAGELLGAARRAVAAIDGQLDAGQRGVARVGTGVEVPVVVDRPQLVGRDELLSGWRTAECVRCRPARPTRRAPRGSGR